MLGALFIDIGDGWIFQRTGVLLLGLEKGKNRCACDLVIATNGISFEDAG